MADAFKHVPKGIVGTIKPHCLHALFARLFTELWPVIRYQLTLLG